MATSAKTAKPSKRQPKAAPAGSQAPSADEPTPQGKSIFLFSDGTGNSSAKLFKTNVWRMYEAIDFGLARPGNRVQVGYYDNGVGTSSFRPLALLGGIFGIGLKSNVLRLYAFLCRTYQPNDRIYAFGFSRGAFTIRLLVALVASQGILRTEGDAPLSYQVRDAYRAFRKTFLPNRWIGRIFIIIGRAIRDEVLSFKRRVRCQVRYRYTERTHPDIEFVGVWDTVAAYGGPFAEFTRGIDDWLYPLSMPEYGLSPKVRKARHALALDDERDAFWPLLWDEVREADLVKNGAPAVVKQFADCSDDLDLCRVPEGRLKQVWFSGVHSDVGGGYPDESLSYISLLWMMDELGDDVHFLDAFVRRAQDLANPYGPIHDSRKGPAAYYRYQPRKIAAFLHKPSLKTLSLRPPERDHFLGSHGLLRSVCVHESAISRIISGIDNYAPCALPAQFEIVRAPAKGHARPILTDEDNKKLAAAEPCRQLRYELQENLWDKVWWRRLLYFLTVGLTLLLATGPWLPIFNQVEQLCSDDRCFARSFVDFALFFLPQSLRNSLDPWASMPLLVIGLGSLILACIAIGRRTERSFRDAVRRTWRNYLDHGIDFEGATGLRKTRESGAYQYPLYWLKWGVLPAISGWLSIAAIAYGLVIAATQVLYARVESRSRFCQPPQPILPGRVAPVVAFNTAESCTDLGVDVEKGQPYRLTLTDVRPTADGNSPWRDGSIKADPRLGVTSAPLYMKLFAPMKRVASANWMQILTQVRADKPDTAARRFVRPLFGLPIDMRKHRLDFHPEEASYDTVLCAPWDGRLYLMVNDAAPLLSMRFYGNNVGTARVKVEPAPDKKCT